MATVRQSPRDPSLSQVRCYYKDKEITFEFGPAGNKTAKSVAEDFCHEYNKRYTAYKAGLLEVPDRVVTKLDMIRFLAKREEIDKEDDKKLRLADLIEQYLEHRQKITRKPGHVKKKGEKSISLSNYKSDVSRLKTTLLGYAKKQGITLVERVNTAKFLTDFKNHIKGQSLAAGTKIHAMRTLKAMLKWTYREEIIDELPRNLEEYVDIAPEDPSPEVFSVKQLHQLLKEASPLLRACIMLGLNCGFTSVDCSTLVDKYLDLENNILEKNRGKTGVYGRYRLWPETVMAVEKARSADKSGPAICRENGQPLITDQMNQDGTVKGSDFVSKNFRTLVRKSGINGLSFRDVKKTSSTIIEDDFSRELSDRFLSHKIPGMSVHYNKKTKNSKRCSMR